MRRRTAGELKLFTGVDSPYEVPERPEVHLAAGELSVAECVNELLAHLDRIGALRAGYQPLAVGA